MAPDEKTRLRKAFNAVTAGMDADAVKGLEKRVAVGMDAALVEYEALARLTETHSFALVIRGAESAFITLPKKKDETGDAILHLLDGAVIRI